MLTGCLAALGHFIGRFTDKLRSFFLTLRGANTTRWTSECQQAFEEIKTYLTRSLILSSLEPDEQLYMYLVVSECTVSVVLFRHVKDKEQRLVYYVSKAMTNAVHQDGTNNFSLKKRYSETLPVFPSLSGDYAKKHST